MTSPDPRLDTYTYLDVLRNAYFDYTTAISSIPMCYGSAWTDALLPWYDIAMRRYRKAVRAVDAARNYIRWLSSDNCAAKDHNTKVFADELLEIVPAGKIPHPNGYLNNEQRAVLVLLDKLEKEEA